MNTFLTQTILSYLESVCKVLLIENLTRKFIFKRRRNSYSRVSIPSIKKQLSLLNDVRILSEKKISPL